MLDQPRDNGSIVLLSQGSWNDTNTMVPVLLEVIMVKQEILLDAHNIDNGNSPKCLSQS